MSKIDHRSLQEIDAIQTDLHRERNLRRIDIGLNVGWFVLWNISWWYLRPRFFPSVFDGPIWVFLILGFLCLLATGLAYYLTRWILDALFKTGRKSPFRSYLLYLVAASLVISIVVTVLVFAASKTADLLF